MSCRLIFPFTFIPFAEEGRGVFVIAGERLEGFVGNAFFEFFAFHETDDGIAAFDVVVEETEWFAGNVGFEPESDFAELDSERVQIDAIDAVSDDIADGFAVGGRAWLIIPGADNGQSDGNAASGGEENVT